ncbi:hypothetical protein HMPREF9538_04058 [Klebsiella sp. MS 92-3]|nr:hypothetical protein HMPREF9538_04058 [Klebsiella sp. MS 92-3]
MPGKFQQNSEEKATADAIVKVSTQTGTSINRLRNTEGRRRRGKPSREPAR